jgi:hypothetical protein
MKKTISLSTFLTAFLIMAVFTVGVVTTGCPRERADSNIRKAAKASFELAGVTNDTVTAVGRAYTDGIISLEQKDRLADKLVILAKGGKTFNAAVRKAAEVYSTDVDPPPSEIDLLIALFDSDVISPFLEFLAAVGGINAPPYLATAVEMIRNVVLQIARGFGRERETETRLKIAAVPAETVFYFNAGEVMLYGRS